MNTTKINKLAKEVKKIKNLSLKAEVWYLDNTFSLTLYKNALDVLTLEVLYTTKGYNTSYLKESNIDQEILNIRNAINTHLEGK